MQIARVTFISLPTTSTGLAGLTKGVDLAFFSSYPRHKICKAKFQHVDYIHFSCHLSNIYNQFTPSSNKKKPMNILSFEWEYG